MNPDPIQARALDAMRHLGDPDPPWDEILEGACHILGGDTATLIMIGGDGALLSLQQRHIQPATERDYVEHFFAQDILVPVAHDAPAGTWFDTQELFSPAFLSRNGFYVDFMCRHRMHQLVTYILADDPRRRGGLTVQRGRTRMSVERPDRSRDVRAFTTALRQGMARRGEEARTWFGRMDVTLAAFDEALCLATLDGLVVQTSPLADTRFGTASFPLQLRDGRLWHRDARTREALRAALARAGAAPEARSMKVTDSQGQAFAVDMVRADARLSLARETLIMVRLRRLDADGPADVEALRLAFDLTPAEARVLRALAEGMSSHQYAQARGVSHHTVRSQIKTLLQKLDCARQIDLVRAAMRIR